MWEGLISRKGRYQSWMRIMSLNGLYKITLSLLGKANPKSSRGNANLVPHVSIKVLANMAILKWVHLLQPKMGLLTHGPEPR